MTAIEELKAEHEAVLLTIRIMDKINTKFKKGVTVDAGHLEQILEFLQVFVDRCHHGKEEKVLFPAMVGAGIPQQGGPIGVMLYEHDEGRSFVQGFKKGVEGYRKGEDGAVELIIDNSKNYGELLTAHIDKENNVLYVMAERVLSPQKMAELERAFAQIEENEIGPNKHEEFHNILHTLRDIYLT
jgi:hemerythrin-like domain-containing protein